MYRVKKKMVFIFILMSIVISCTGISFEFGKSGLLPDLKIVSDVYAAGATVWSSAGNMSTARVGHTITLLNNGSVLVVGGYNGSAYDRGAEITEYNSLASAELYNPVNNTWTSAGNMTAARYGHAALLLNDGRVFVVGGTTGNTTTSNSPLSSAEVYNPSNNTWLSAGNMTTASANPTAILLSDNKVLVIYGGSSQIYNPSLNTWSSKATLCNANLNPTITLLNNGKVLLTGGTYNGTFSNSNKTYSSSAVQIFDPGTNRWTSAGSMSVERVNHTATLLSSGKVLIVGGKWLDPSSPMVVGSFGFQSSAELYDPNTNTWSSAGNMAFPRGYHFVTILSNGKVLVAGGETELRNGSLTSFSYTASSELYDPGTNSWSKAGSMCAARNGATVVSLKNGRVMAIGGQYYDGKILASSELFDPDLNIWLLSNNMNTTRLNFLARLLNDGRVLIVGGMTDLLDTTASYTSSPELYDPNIDSLSQANIGNTYKFNVTSSLQTWVVPNNASKIRIQAAGSEGGVGVYFYNPTSAGGKGAVVAGEFDITPGDTLRILAGQKGNNGAGSSGFPSKAGGGGGGSFVAKQDNTPLIAAGGGGGGGSANAVMLGGDALASTSSVSNGGLSGDSTFNGNGAGGGGFAGDGQSDHGRNITMGGRSFLNRGSGGTGSTNGGFGGGGAASSAGGGGGGYSGGDGGTQFTNCGGSGGTSYNAGKNQVSAVGNLGDGYVIITLLNSGPAIISTSPANNATNIGVSTLITATFSRAIQSGTTYNNIALKDSSGNTVTATNSINGSVLTIVPSANLLLNKTYTVTIPASAVKDMSGNDFGSDYSFKFTTEATPSNLYTPTVTGSGFFGDNALLDAIGNNIEDASYRIFYTTSATPPAITDGGDEPGSGWIFSDKADSMTINNTKTDASEIIPGVYLSNTNWTYVTFKLWAQSTSGSTDIKYSAPYSLRDNPANVDTFIGYVGHNQILRNGTVISNPNDVSDNVYIDGDTVKYRFEFDVTKADRIKDVGIAIDSNLYNDLDIQLQSGSFILKKGTETSPGSGVYNYSIIKDYGRIAPEGPAGGKNRYTFRLNDVSGNSIIKANGTGRYAIEYTGTLKINKNQSINSTVMRNLAEMIIYTGNQIYPNTIEQVRSNRKFFMDTNISKYAVKVT